MTTSTRPGAGPTYLKRDLRVPPEDRVNLFMVLQGTLERVACKLDIEPRIVRKARAIALPCLFGEPRLLQDPADFELFVCRAIGEAKIAGPTTASVEPANEGDSRDSRIVRRACSERCVWAGLGRILRRMSGLEKLLLSLQSKGLTDEEAALVLAVPPPEIAAMRTRTAKAIREMRCEHLKLAFPEESESRA